MPTENNCKLTYQFFLRAVHIDINLLVFIPKNKAKAFTLWEVHKVISLSEKG